MDYFEVTLQDYPTAVYEEIDHAGASRFTDVAGATVDGVIPTVFLKRSWCTVRQPWMEPLSAATHLQDPLMVNTRTLIDLVGLTAADAILTALEHAAIGMPALGRVLKLLDPAQGGIDLHSPQTQGMIDQLAVAGVFTAAQAAALKGL